MTPPATVREALAQARAIFGPKVTLLFARNERDGMTIGDVREDEPGMVAPAQAVAV